MPNRRKSKDQPSTWQKLRHRLFCDLQLPLLRHAPEPLVLPLRPSSRLRLAAGLLVLAVLLYLLELLITGHWLAAGGTAAIAACGAWYFGWQAGAASPRVLLVSTEGRLFLDFGMHRIEEARLHSESLRLGPHVLLVLALGARKHRLLLGPDNLGPHLLAALKCRLPQGPARAMTALHSRPSAGRSYPP